MRQRLLPDEPDVSTAFLQAFAEALNRHDAAATSSPSRTGASRCSILIARIVRHVRETIGWADAPPRQLFPSPIL